MTFIEERRGQVTARRNYDTLTAALTPCGTRRVVTVGNRSIALPAHPNSSALTYEAGKRALDVTVASFLLLMLFPLLLLVALLIVLEDRGPVFYYQLRVGKNGRAFRFFKFRSMVTNADAIKAQLEAQNEANGPIFKMRQDPRVTRIGRILRRYSIDELPQLVNVLRGDMSLIGPRPHLPREVALYDDRQQERLQVQPGLLCFREVLGRSNMTFEHWVELDLLYIEYRCWQTDLAILARAVPAVLSADGAY